uniref:NADH-plastoquinone oxidoreductase subunit 7 n=1 Tax=Epidendrum diffusum TaxID=634106 RepID=UPI002B312BF4|nr:NADH-plastoquinone oxidoreductase subunit 7 [Epidendrum diffusum]WNS59560.1 NADH-plastoquinone oxidoreductase subunit 7 [Epidendrum diffusum]
MTVPATRKDLIIVNMVLTPPINAWCSSADRYSRWCENVINCEPILGYLHRGMEKIEENKTIIQYLPYVTRWDSFIHRFLSSF